MYFLGNRDENWARDKSAGGDWDVKTYRAWEESGVESWDDGHSVRRENTFAET